MVDEAAQRAWVARVLGVVPGAAGSEPLLPIWLNAKEAVDGRLGQLRHALENFDDSDLNRIAEFGLNGVTGTSSVGLMVALREADAPGAPAAARAKLASAIASYRAFLDSDVSVKLLEVNPFGVKLGLKSTLGGALDTLSRRIAA